MVWENWTTTCKGKKLDSYYKKKDSKWITFLKITPEIVKLLEENKGEAP